MSASTVEQIRDASVEDIRYAAMKAYGVHWLGYPLCDGRERQCFQESLEKMSRSGRLPVAEIVRRLRTLDNTGLHRVLDAIEAAAGEVKR